MIVIRASTDNNLMVQDYIQEYLKMKINNILVFIQDVFVLRIIYMYFCFRNDILHIFNLTYDHVSCFFYQTQN